MYRRMFLGAAFIALAAGSASAQQHCRRGDIALTMDQARHRMEAVDADRRSSIELGRTTASWAAVTLGVLSQFVSDCGCEPLSREFTLASKLMAGAVEKIDDDAAFAQHLADATTAINKGMKMLRNDECPAIVRHR